jgi:hypothetical protein
MNMEAARLEEREEATLRHENELQLLKRGIIAIKQKTGDAIDRKEKQLDQLMQQVEVERATMENQID